MENTKTPSIPLLVSLYLVLYAGIYFSTYFSQTADLLPLFVLSVALLIAKFALDFAVFRFGGYLLCCSLIFLPLWSLVVFWPIGLVKPFEIDLIHGHQFDLLLIYLNMSIVFSILGLINRKRIRAWEEESVSAVQAALRTDRASFLATITFSVMAVFSAIIAKPSLPFSKTYAEQVTPLLPGNAWVLLGSLACFFLVLNWKSLIAKLSVVFFISWVVGNYSRVEVVGIVVFGLLLAARTYKPRSVATLAVAFFGLFGLVGLIRDKAQSSFIDLAVATGIQIANNDTAQNILYGSAAYLEYVSRFGHMFTVPSLISRTFLPSFLTEERVFSSAIIERDIHFNWGSFFANEFYLNLGMTGALLAPLALYLVTFSLGSRLFRSSPLVSAFVYYSLLILAFRVLWYEPLLFPKFIVYLCIPLLLLNRVLVSFESEKVIKPSGNQNATP